MAMLIHKNFIISNNKIKKIKINMTITNENTDNCLFKTD